MSEAAGNDNNSSAATSKLDVLLLAVSMAAPSPRSHSGTNLTTNDMITAVEEPSIMSAANNSSLQQSTNNVAASPPPLVTPLSTIELLDGSAATLPILEEGNYDYPPSKPNMDMRNNNQSLFTVTSFPAPKMRNSQNSSVFTNTSSLPIKKRFTNREGGPPPPTSLLNDTSSDARVPVNHDTTTTTHHTVAPPPLNTTTTTTKKKEKKKYRKPSCSHPTCPNRVMNRGVCARHGARVRICSFSECSKYAQKGGVCIRHGAKKEYRRCGVVGCNSRVTSGGGGMSVCSRHASICVGVGSGATVAAAADVAERRQATNDGRKMDEEEEQRDQHRETL